MELVSVQRARSVWLFDINDLNPHGRELGSDLLEWVKAEYQFSKFPSTVTDVDESKALYFGGGRFRIHDDRLLIQPIRGDEISVELRVYNDGFVGDTRSSTKDTDAFLSELLRAAASKFNLPYKSTMIRKKLYVSELNVTTEADLSLVNPKISDFAKKLSGAVGRSGPMELTGLSFWADVLPKPSFSFRFERKWGAEFSENRYFSTAPMETDQHLAMLKELELALTAQ